MTFPARSIVAAAPYRTTEQSSDPASAETGSPIPERRKWRLSLAAVGYAGLFVLLFVLLIWPLMMLTIGAFKSNSPLQPGGEWTLDGFVDMWIDINATGALTNSLIFAVLTTIFGVTIAIVLAFLSERTDSPFRTLITPAVLVCAATSTVFYAIGYSLLGNQHTGILNSIIRSITGVRGFINIESWPGLVFVDSLHSAAFLYLFLVGPFRALDRSHEEAALAAGASRLQTLWTINARLLTPILSSVVLIGLVTGLKSFSIPLILGSHADLSFLTVRILRTLQLYQPPRYSEASALALALTVVIVILLIVQHRVIGRRAYVTVTGKSYRQTRWSLVGSWRWAAGAFVVSYVLLGVVLPLGAIVFSSFLPFPGVYRSFGLQNYYALFANPEMKDVLFTTAFATFFGGLAGVTLAFVVAYATHRANPLLAGVLRGSTLLQLAMPGIVGSLALIWAVAAVPVVRQIYGTVWLLLIAFIIGVLTVSVQIASGAVRQVSRELEEAAQVSGASRLRVIFGITARLLLPSLMFAWFLAAIMIVGDLDAPLLLSSAGTRTVSIQIYRLFDGTQESQAAALLTLILAFILLCSILYGLARAFAGWRQRSKRAFPRPRRTQQTPLTPSRALSPAE